MHMGSYECAIKVGVGIECFAIEFLQTALEKIGVKINSL